MAKLTLKVNGTSRDVESDDPDIPLLYVLRDDLKLTGTHFGCGLAQCGACTVLVDGRAVRSCIAPARSVAGHEVVTIEGLGSPDRPDSLQAAFIAEQAAQCGYCTAGMEYRDLGIADATHGKMRAHVIRVKQGGDTHDLHTTGLHKHECDFQMFYVLRGTIKFVYEGVGERTFGPGDCVLQPAGIVHNELECTDDLEVLEIYSPAVHPTVVVDKLPEAVDAATR